MTTPRRINPRLVSNPRNSICASSRLDDLDFSRWWTDGGSMLGMFYLHVSSKHDETTHRVHPRQKKGFKCKRLQLTWNGLYWLYDKEWS